MPLRQEVTSCCYSEFVQTKYAIAVLAERLRRTLKARVRKSVGSIPTDCIMCFFVVDVHPLFLLSMKREASPSSSGRGLNSLEHPGIAQLAERETVDGYN